MRVLSTFWMSHTQNMKHWIQLSIISNINDVWRFDLKIRQTLCDSCHDIFRKFHWNGRIISELLKGCYMIFFKMWSGIISNDPEEAFLEYLIVYHLLWTWMLLLLNGIHKYIQLNCNNFTWSVHISTSRVWIQSLNLDWYQQNIFALWGF